MTIGKFNIQTVLVEDFKRLLFGVEIVKAEEFSYVLFSFGAGGIVVGYK
jgi:hypothetical protein